jgi:multiple sugar transport system ATP-binding protein
VQTGTPDELYLRPADQFVATMVGAPPMNLVPGKVKSGADGPVIALPFADVDGSRWRDLQGGADVLLGIRPHDLVPAVGLDGDRGGGAAFRARVHLTEPLGDITVIDIEAEGTVLKVALPEEQALAYGVGDELALRLSLADAHLFSSDSGTALDAFDK